MSQTPLRVFVTPPSGHRAIPDKAELDLGFNIEMTVIPTEELYHTALSDPGSFDLIQAEFWMINDLRLTGTIQPVRASEVERYDEISPLFLAGEIDGEPVCERGVAPHTVIFADKSRDWLNAVPTICNSDSLGWRDDRTDRTVTSWGDLLDPALAGKVALADVPAVSYIELSLAAEARGLCRYADIGNQTRKEIDRTYEILEEYALNGQFDSLWPSFEQSIERMTEGPVAVQSLWPPAVTALRKSGIPVRYNPMREGGRAWAGGLAVSSRCSKTDRRNALAYTNWYLSGWAGAYLMRQGYSCSTPEAARAYLTEAEWDYWQLGKASRATVNAPDGAKIGQTGEARDGGSFSRRMSHIACWNSRMDEDAHLRARWRKFARIARASAVAKAADSQNLHK
ncbi:ABC transporter substrate-binding protein [Oricola indica]|jgi:putative spermidine/putrescine transport system substrate-binding protein|uniref:ABC transporter substrate-binding protein n=1 Tax=Oricola indica TaxID=2872591 RepID=UPI001CBAC84D|nr:extracellular solute-binding protein [Oricola indica]